MTKEIKMSNEFAPSDISSALSRIRQYAIESGILPELVCDIFSAGIVAARILRPDVACQEQQNAQGVSTSKM